MASPRLMPSFRSNGSGSFRSCWQQEIATAWALAFEPGMRIPWLPDLGGHLKDSGIPRLGAARAQCKSDFQWGFCRRFVGFGEVFKGPFQDTFRNELQSSYS